MGSGNSKSSAKTPQPIHTAQPPAQSPVPTTNPSHSPLSIPVQPEYPSQPSPSSPSSSDHSLDPVDMHSQEDRLNIHNSTNPHRLISAQEVSFQACIEEGREGEHDMDIEFIVDNCSHHGQGLHYPVPSPPGKVKPPVKRYFSAQGRYRVGDVEEGGRKVEKVERQEESKVGEMKNEDWVLTPSQQSESKNAGLSWSKINAQTNGQTSKKIFNPDNQEVDWQITPTSKDKNHNHKPKVVPKRKELENNATTIRRKFQINRSDDVIKTTYSTQDKPVENPIWPNMADIVAGKFKDGDFEPNVLHIVGHKKTRTDKDKSKLKDYETYVWVRAREVIPDYHILSKPMKPTDIYQGNLSNCYLLSVLSALAERPERVVRLLPQTTNNKKGIYSVYLCKTGVFEEVLLDDYFPAKHGKKFKFCHSRNGDIWAMLIEKAYAKMFGAYWNIGLGGCAVNALKDLSGCPAEIVSLNDMDEDTVWKKVESALSRKFVVIASSKSDPGLVAKGLAQWHAYTVLAVHSFDDRKLIRMRNPWGKGIWKCNDPLLNKVNDDIQKGSKDDAGVFVMPFEELLPNFDEISIGHYVDTNIYSQKKVKYKENDLYPYEVRIEKAGSYYLSVSKPDKRFYGGPSEDSFISVVLVKVDCHPTKWIGAAGGIHRDPFFEEKMEPGLYLAFVNISFRDNFGDNYFSLNLYGPGECKIEPLAQSSYEESLQLFREGFLDRCQRLNSWTPFNTPGREFNKIFYSFVHGNDGYGYCAIWNKDPSINIEADVEFEGSSVSVIVPPGAGGTKATIVANSGQMNVAVYEIHTLPCRVHFKAAIKRL
jgi:hypothetical protein